MIFIDLETGGLNPRENDVLEIAAARVDHRFEILDTLHVILRPTGRHMDSTAEAMHERSGLLPDARARGVDVATARGALSAFVGGVTFTLAGAGPHFDLAFMRHHFPDVAQLANARLFDVNTLIDAWRLAGRTPCPIARRPRAVGSVVASIGQAKWFQERISK